MGTLYVVATPIGNLEDVSLRALRVLREVGAIAAEDTRTARVLLDHYGIKSHLISYNEHNRSVRIPEIVGRLIDSDIALVSDAGTPAISDPGVELVAAARAAGHAVVAVPGASAVVAALSVAGLATRTYRFVGFLPRTAGERRRLFESLQQVEDTVVAFESPRRLQATLTALAETLPERPIAVLRELTKLHEEAFVGMAAEALAHFDAPRGEIVLVIEGAAEGTRNMEEGSDGDEAVLRAEIAVMRSAGLTQSQASALLGRRFKTPRRRLYELWLDSGRR